MWTVSKKSILHISMTCVLYQILITETTNKVILAQLIIRWETVNQHPKNTLNPQKKGLN